MTISSWPTNSLAADAAFYEIRRTHRLVLIQVFNMFGVQVLPKDWRPKLAGALAEVTFSLA